MTNGDKYLRDNVSVEELVKELCFKFYEKRVANYAQDKITIQEVLTNYFNKEVTPTLTEDERVILRNIRNDYKFIGKMHFLGAIFLYASQNEKGEDFTTLTSFDHLFQFIKERRRIRDKGIVRR